MSFEEYTQKTSHAQPLKKVSEPKFSVGTVIVSALVGFLGGFLAINLGGSTIINESTATQTVLQESDAIANLAEEVSESVVSVNVTGVEDSFNPFFGRTQSEFDSEGTGIILTEDGLIVTNKHVVDESATDVDIVLSDGTVLDDVEIVGRDPFNDIAFLQVQNVDSLKPAELGDSKEVRVGDKAIAIGNALGEFDTTVTAGIISGVGRPIIAGSGSDSEALSNLFQTDASINPGNSGGPLLNINGEVIGINTAVAGNGAENIGFAIPINDVKSGITSVKENGELVRPYLGVSYITLNEELAEELELEVAEGAHIFDSGEGTSILSDSPAEKAGIEEGDTIVTVNGEKLTAENILPLAVGNFQVGETITLEVLRGDEVLSLEVTLERIPENL